MELEDSLQRLQESSNGSYPVPDEFTQYHHILFL
jgi:hypothetical protein